MADPIDPIIPNDGDGDVEGGGNVGDNVNADEREESRIPPPPPPVIPVPQVSPLMYVPRPDPLMRPFSPFVPSMNNDGRGGTPGAGSSRDNTNVKNPLNIPAVVPLGNSQNSTQVLPPVYAGPTFPMQKVEVVTAENFGVWRVRIRLAAVNARCIQAFQSPMPGSEQDNAAMLLLSNSVPTEWQGRVLEQGSAYDGVCWVCEQYCGGSNTYLVDELERKFAGLKYSSKESIDQYVNRGNNIASNLAENGRAVSKSSLVTKIVAGLPDLFNNSKASLRLTGKNWTLDQLCAEIKAEAFNLDSTKSSAAPAKALFTEEKSPYSGKTKNQGSGGRGNGTQSQRKIKGNCWTCNKPGHCSRDCRMPDNGMKFRPNREGGTSQKDEPKALVTVFKGGNKGTWADIMDSQEWVVDSGATHHITGNPALLHDYVHYSESKPLSTAVKSDVSQIVGQGTVCMESPDGTTFWLDDVRYVPGLTQNLFSVASGIAQNFIMGTTPNGEHTSVALPTGEELCKVVKVNNQYLMDARALEGEDKRTYFAMLAREGRTADVCAMATNVASPDSWEIWHRRLGHPSPTAMYRLVKECMVKGVSIPETLLKQCKSRRCECCILGKQSHLPFPLSETQTSRPLELVHADICGKMEQETNNGGRYFLSVLDDLSKYSEVVILRKKSEAKHALIEILTRWENITEVKVKYLRTDGGKEFTGKLVTDFCTSKGITHQVTPRHTPQSNGKIERLNRTFKEKVRCILIDSRIDVEWWGYALEYAAFLRNRLPASGKGLTPYELFFHKQPDLSLVRVFGCKAYVRLEKKDAALTKLGPQSETGIFLGMEPDTKAYRVLIGTEIRVSRHVVFSEEKHKSAGTVVGPMPVEHEEYDEVPDLQEDDYVWIAEVRRQQPYIDPFLSAEYRDARTGETHLVENGDSDDEATGPAALPPREVANMSDDDDDDEPPELSYPDDESDSDDDNPPELCPPSDDEDDGDADYSGTALRNRNTGAVVLDGSDVVGPTATNKAVGATNRYPLRSKGPVRAELVVALNVMALAVSSDMSEVIIPKSYAEAMRTDQSKLWEGAMTDEINSIVSKETFTWVPRPLNTKVIPTRWVYAVKHDAMGNIQRFKGRVVAKGFKQELGIDFNETYAPVCNQSTRRVLFSIAAQKRLHMHQMDVKTAFLNGELTDLTYCEPPPGYPGERGMVWKLHKALYGLKQAPRAWHECLVKALVAGGFVVTNADPGLFIKTTKAGLIYLITYVDDIIICGADLTEVEIVKKYLSGVFEVTDLGEVAHFLGNVVVRTSNSVRVSNPVKVKELLADYGIDSPRKVTTPMDPSFVITEMSVEAGKTGGSGKPLPEGNRYNELIGSLMYLANTTRPDLTLAVGLLSRFRSKPTTAHWSAGLRVLAYLYYTPDLGLEYCGDHDLVGYVDSAFADDKDEFHSTMGYTFLLNGAAVSWASKKQRGIASSTVEAEYCAFHLAACHALWLQLLLHEMVGRKGPITIYCDSTGCISNLKNFMSSGYTRHIGVKYHASRQMVANQQIAPVYVQTDENIADVFTKPLANIKFSKFVNGLGMT